MDLGEGAGWGKGEVDLRQASWLHRQSEGPEGLESSLGVPGGSSGEAGAHGKSCSLRHCLYH